MSAWSQFIFTSNTCVIIGYYTVDCAIPKYIWTSAQMTTILDEPMCCKECDIYIYIKHDWIGETLGSKWSESGTKRKQHDNAEVTFRIVLTTDEKWQARSDLSESVCS